MVKFDCGDGVPCWPFVYYKEKGTQRRRLHILWPLITWNITDRGNKTFALLYFLFRWTLKVTENTQYLDFFWPIVHYEKNQVNGGWRFGIRPFLWIANEQDQTLFSILGLLLYWNKRAGGGSTTWFHLLPFILYRRDAQDNYMLFVLPLLCRVTTAASKHLVLLLPPIYWSVDRNKPDARKFAILPLIWYITKTGGRYRFFIIPFIWFFKDGPNDFVRLFLPIFYYRRKNANQCTFSLAFIIWYHRYDSPVKQYLIALVPFIWHYHSDPKETDQHQRPTNVVVLFPFIWYFTFENVRLLCIFPFVWHGTTFKPAAEGGNDVAWILFPYLWYFKPREGQLRLFFIPFVYVVRNSATDYLYGFFSIFWMKRYDNPNQYTYIVVPFVWYFRYSEIAYHFVIFPLLWVQKVTQDQYSCLLLPVFRYAQLSDKDKGLVIAWVVWYKVKDDACTFLIFPFVWYFQTNMEDYKFVIFPVLWKFHYGKGHYDFIFLFIPLVVVQKNEALQEVRFHLWPVLGYSKTISYTEYSTVYPLVILRLYTAQQMFKLYVLYPFIYVCLASNLYHHRILPLYWYYKTPTEDRGFMMLYYWHMKSAVKKRALGRQGTQKIVVEEEKKPPNSSTPIIRLETPEPPSEAPITVEMPEVPEEVKAEYEPIEDSIKLQPTKSMDEPSQKLNPHQKEENKIVDDGSCQFRMLFPLLYLYNTPVKMNLVILPLFWLNYNFANKNHFFLSCLYFRKKTTDVLTHFLIPVFFMHDDPTKTNVYSIVYILKHVKNGGILFRMLPFYLHIAKGAFALTLLPFFISYRKAVFSFKCLFPFFYSQEDTSNQSSIIYFFPFYGRVKKGDFLTRHLIMFPLYSYHNDTQTGTISFDLLWPLCTYKTSTTVREFRVWPFYWHKFSPKLDFRFVLLLYWSFKTDKENKKNRYILMLPFFFHKSNVDFTFTVGSPLVIFPPYFVRYSNYGSGLKVTSWWPLFGSAEEASESSTIWKILSKAVLISYYHNTTMAHRIFYILLVLWKKWDTEGSMCTCIFWLVPPKICVMKNSYQPYRGSTNFVFPVYHYQATHQHKSFALLWLFFPRKLSAFCYKVSGYLNLDSFEFTRTKLKIWLFPIFFYREMDDSKLLCVLYIWADYLNVFKWYTTAELTKHFVFPVYYKECCPNHDVDRFAVMWLVHPFVSVYFKSLWRDGKNKCSWLFPVYWYRRDDNEFMLNALWVVPKWVSLYKYYSAPNIILHWLFPVYYKQNTSTAVLTEDGVMNVVPDEDLFAVGWLFHPIISAYRKIDKYKQFSTSWIVFVYWYCKDLLIGETYVCILWIVPRWVSVFKYYSNDTIKRHFIFPVYYSQVEAEAYTFALGWLFHPDVSLYYRFSSPSNLYLPYKSRLFPIFYKHRAGNWSQFTMFWLFHPVASLYYYERTGNGSPIVWLFPIFWYNSDLGTHEKDEVGANEFKCLCILWIIPKWVCAYQYYATQTLTRHWMFPLYYRERGADNRSLFSFFWLFHPLVAAYHYSTGDLKKLVFLFPVFFYKNDNRKTLLQFMWLVPNWISAFKYSKHENHWKHFIVLLYYRTFSAGEYSTWAFVWLKADFSLFYRSTVTNNSGTATKTWLFPLIYHTYASSTEWCLLYIYPPKFALIHYKDQDFVIHMIYHSEIDGIVRNTSILYFFWPKASFIRISTSPHLFKLWMFLFFWIEHDTDVSTPRRNFALMWIYSPLFAPISYRSNGGANETGFHIAPFLWYTRKFGYSSWGLLWAFYYPVSLICYLSTADRLIHFVLPFYVLYCKPRATSWKFFFMLGFLYAAKNDLSVQFRVFYRLIRIKTGDDKIVEFNPFYYYNRKPNGSKWLLCGGCCGKSSFSGRSDTCRCGYCITFDV